MFLVSLAILSLAKAIPSPFFIGTYPGFAAFGLQSGGYRTYNYLSRSQGTGSAVGYDPSSQQILAVIDSSTLPMLVTGASHEQAIPSATTIMVYDTQSCDDWFMCTSGNAIFVTGNSSHRSDHALDGDWADLTVDDNGIAYAIDSRTGTAPTLSFVTFKVPSVGQSSSPIVERVRHPLDAPDGVDFYGQIVPLPSGNVIAVGIRKAFEYGSGGGKPVTAKPVIDLDSLGVHPEARISAVTLDKGTARNVSEQSLLFVTTTMNFTLWRAPLASESPPTVLFDFSSQNASGAPDSSLTLCEDGKTLYFTNVATTCVDTLVLSYPPIWTPSVWCVPGHSMTSPSIFPVRMTKLAGTC